ncbi:unnamed protein product [Phaedon cochleariae]|uniref:Tight junction-associated protein 1 n=1 Tax=Phaedon cochleariae TaxID=80249 RepID=A0A9P0DBS8_PHACE|nr:unnamed protein product [Phaedon cochleariae]
MANKCKDCGCTCRRCISSDHDVQLHVEIENLKRYLLEKENHIVTMETNFLNEANKFPNGQLVSVQEEMVTWQDKYKRLYDAHRRVQRVNQGLEDKLLKLVDVCETDKNTLTKDVAILSHKLAEANYAIKKLTEDNERYKNDVSLAIQFLQCKQTNFVAKRYDSLPAEVQSQVSNFMTTKKKPEERKPSTEVKNIKVPIPTFPPTAMVYSVPKSPNPERKSENTDMESAPVDIVSAAIMAKVLEERLREKANAKHCDSCTCSTTLKIVFDITQHSIGTQTGEYKDMVCLRCNDSVNPNSIMIVRNPEPKSQKVVPIYPLETLDTIPPTNQNIVKVQPNNFLLDKKSKSSSVSSSLIDLNQTSPKTSTNNLLIHIAPKTHQDFSVQIANEKQEHHRLCDKSALTYEVDLTSEKSDTEINDDVTSAKNSSPKGPRYCSMRVQSGSKNILLDNAHNNIAPVLYTRSHKIKMESRAQTYDSSDTETSGEKLISMASDTSVQNRQRVADWIQSNIENELSSSENSRSEPVPVTKKKYAEMEENVKRFLFGESEFLKTVEKGKMFVYGIFGGVRFEMKGKVDFRDETS